MNTKGELKKNGFLTIKKLVPKKKCEEVLKNTFTLLCRFSKVPEKLKKSKKPWKEKLFHECMQKLRTENPEAFGAMYDSATSSIALNNLFTDANLTKKIASLLDTKPESFSLSGLIQRMDPPNDSRNLYDWHQERSYYPQNRDGLNGIVVWIPLMDISLNSGALVVAKGSHKKGYVKSSAKKDTELHSTQYKIPSEIVDKYESVMKAISAGDALLMYMTTMHKSSNNESDKFRFVAIGRYHNETTDDFIPFRNTNKYNEYVKNILEKNGEDVSDII